MSSFTVKQLRVRIILAAAGAVFPSTNSNTLIIDKLRIETKVQASALLASQADIRIYGMRASDMQAVSLAWANFPIILNNLVILEANNTGRTDGWTQVFSGTITEGLIDFNSMPNVYLHILASTGYYQKIFPVKPSSYPGAASIATIAQNLVDLMGPPWALAIGQGADAMLSNQYLWGTLWDQLTQACAAAKCDFYVQGDQILVTGRGQPLKTEPAVVLSPSSGLAGFPTYERGGLILNALFDPAFLCGVAIEVQSSVPNATGRWFPYSLLHNLESLKPNGAWFTQMQCNRVLV